jgi:hypothetical protein
MICEMVCFKVPEGWTREQVVEDARTVVPKWQANSELVRKHFIWNGSDRACGIYLWKTRAAAEAAHNDEWRQGVAERTGGDEPEISYFDCFMIVDNERGEVTEFPPPV